MRKKERIPQHKINCQVNHLIIRYLWKKGNNNLTDLYNSYTAPSWRKDNGNDNDNDKLWIKISAPRYTRYIDFGEACYSKEELTFLNDKTGLNAGYFTGELCLITAPDINNKDDMWVKLFVLRRWRHENRRLQAGVIKNTNSVSSNLENEYKEQLKKCMSVIDDLIGMISDSREEYPGLYILWYYVQNKKKSPDLNSPAIRVQDALYQLQLLDFGTIDQCGDSLCEELLEILNQKLYLVQTVMNYKELRSSTSK